MCLTAKPKGVKSPTNSAKTRSATAPANTSSAPRRGSVFISLGKKKSKDEKKEGSKKDGDKKEEKKHDHHKNNGKEHKKKKKEPTLEEVLSMDADEFELVAGTEESEERDKDKDKDKERKESKEKDKDNDKEKDKPQPEEKVASPVGKKEKQKKEKEKKKTKKEKEKEPHAQPEEKDGGLHDSSDEPLPPSPVSSDIKKERKRSILRPFGGSGGSARKGSNPDAKEKDKDPGSPSNWKAQLQGKRSLLLIVENTSQELMIRRGEPKLISGTWARPPPAVISSGSEAEFGAFANNVVQGVKGSCNFSMEGLGSFVFTFHHAKVGTAEVKCDHPKAFVVERKGELSKNAEIRFIVSYAKEGKRLAKSDNTPSTTFDGFDDAELDSIVQQMVPIVPRKEER